MLIAFIFSNTAAFAQRHANTGLTYGGGSNGDGSPWGISVSAGYDSPLGDLGTTFKAAPTFSIGLNRNFGNFTISSNIGFVSFAPKQDTIFADPLDHTQGYTKYSNYTSIEFYLGAAYNISFGDKAKLYLGFNLGTYYTSLTYDENDGQGDDNSDDSFNEIAYIAPKLGVNFMLTENMSLGIEGKYNFLISSASGTGDAYDSGYSSTVDKSVSGNVVLTYSF